MAQFRATLDGQRGQASRLGSKKSGILARVNAWSVGVKVVGFVDEQTGEDCFELWSTGGSKETMPPAYIGTVRGKQGGGITFENRGNK